MEEWRDVVGYEGVYEVSSFGNVRRVDLGHHSTKEGLKSQRTDPNGYKQVDLWNGSGRTHRVHRLVAKAFIPNPKKKRTVNHKDGDKTNNHVDNLEWATYSENNQHMHDTGLQWKSSLSPDDLCEAFRLYNQGWTFKELKEKYNGSVRYMLKRYTNLKTRVGTVPSSETYQNQIGMQSDKDFKWKGPIWLRFREDKDE